MLKVKVRKIGNSLGAIPPGEVAARLRIKEGDSLSVTETPDGIQLSPYDPEFEAAMGGMLVGVGLLMATGSFETLAFWLLEAFPALGAIG